MTVGPGSYTGLRIALTIAKVLTRFNPIDLYSVSTLRAYCPLDGLKNMVLMDARSNRVYAAAYQDHLELLKPCVLPLDEAEVMAQSMDSIYGNVDQGKVPKILESMWDARSEWTKVNDVDGLVPLYLKDDSAYGRP